MGRRLKLKDIVMQLTLFNIDDFLHDWYHEWCDYGNGFRLNETTGKLYYHGNYNGRSNDNY